jgi:phosphoenolpyruvate phosphomutase
MVIARIESLILEAGLKDAIKRAQIYIDAGASGIMIHSKKETADEIFKFCSFYKKFKRKVPLIVVPSTYDIVYENQLAEAGVSIVIYANQLIRSAYPAMVDTAKKILTHQRAYEARENMMPISEIIKLIPDCL